MLIPTIAFAGLMAMAQGTSSDTELFEALDANGDGVIAATELKESQRLWFTRALRVSDTNKDGRLSPQELTGAFADPEPRSAPDGRSGRQRRQFDPGRLDRNGDGMITLDEVPERARERFEKMLDRTGKKSISVDEMARMRERSGGKGRSNKKASEEMQMQIEGKAGKKKSQDNGDGARRGRKRGEDGNQQQRLIQGFRRLDANSDGKVTRREAQRAPQFIQRFDRNEDGVVERSELTGGKAGSGTSDKRKQAGNRRNQGAGRQGMMDRFDSNKDGQLSRSEVPQQMKARFDRIDSNGDGRLSRQEMQAAAERRGKKSKSAAP